MIGTTLDEIRSAVEELASEDGSYYLVCARTGDRPVPAADLRFERRASARAAATATEQYRAALRRYDPQLPYYDVVATQASEPASDGRAELGETGAVERPRRPCDAVLDDERFVSTNGDASGERSVLVECCHRVAAAVFEALSGAGHDDVETTVMDAYLDLAEAVADPDDLCLCLLECTATAIDRELTPHQQAAVVSGAVTRLPTPETTDRPVSATLHRLRKRGLIGGHVHSPWSVDRSAGTRSVVCLLSEYALSPRNDRLPVLPLVVELFRHQPRWQPASLSVVDVDPGWKLELTLDRNQPPVGLASAPIRDAV